MKRIGLLKRQSDMQNPCDARISSISVDERTASEQLGLCRDAMVQLERDKATAYEDIRVQLRDHGVWITELGELTQPQRHKIRSLFVRRYLDLVEYEWVKPEQTSLDSDSYAFPDVENLSTNLLVTVKEVDGQEHRQLVVRMPHKPHGSAYLSLHRVGRFSDDQYPGQADAGTPESLMFVHLADVIADNIDLLFPAKQVISCDQFHIIRNANTGPVTTRLRPDWTTLIAPRTRQHRWPSPSRLLENARTHLPVCLVTTSSMSIQNRDRLSRSFGLDSLRDVYTCDAQPMLVDVMDVVEQTNLIKCQRRR